MNYMGILEGLKQEDKTARIVLKDGSIVVGEPFCKEEDLGPDEDEDGFRIEIFKNNKLSYVDVLKSQIVSVEEVPNVRIA